MEDFYQLKQQLYQHCMAYADGRIHAAQLGLDEAQASAAQDTKSSAGDKYETGREMLQQETNRYAGQLQEAKKLKHALGQIKLSGQQALQAEAGSLVVTTNGNFYIAISAGTFTIDGTAYYAISPGSPIGLKLKGLVVNDSFTLNQKHYVITAIR